MITIESMKHTDIRVSGCELYFLPIETRVPLKFGSETLTEVSCARCRVVVETRDGRRVSGWGETPLSVQWVWPSQLSYTERESALIALTREIGAAWANFACWGHPIEIGYDFQLHQLPTILSRVNSARADTEDVPYLAALVCCSLFDIAVHDAFGIAVDRPVYRTYTAEFLNRDLATLYHSGLEQSEVRHGGDTRRHIEEVFPGVYPADYLSTPEGTTIPAWHLVGGKDLLREDELTGAEPDDGYPVLLDQWIKRDGLKCLKVKLTGTDAEWDYARLARVGIIGNELGVDWLTADFNCQVTDPDYVNGILDKIRDREPRIYGMILYVEQPFPYDLEANPIDVHSVSARKPLFMDESAHDWRLVEIGASLGWTGVALKTCKTQTGALLSLCWAKSRGMTVMVQDLTNPMLAQIPHLKLGYFAGTIMGVETNGMQFYPAASRPEATVHPGMYDRSSGTVDLSTSLGRPGFGYRIDEIDRDLPEPDSTWGEVG
jgi:L-alanine-DL-glutamate epimerase-like enolase superfamily enzyme